MITIKDVRDFFAWLILSWVGKVVLLFFTLAIGAIFGLPMAENNENKSNGSKERSVIYFDLSNCSTITSDVIACFEDTQRDKPFIEE